MRRRTARTGTILMAAILVLAGPVGASSSHLDETDVCVVARVVHSSAPSGDQIRVHELTARVAETAARLEARAEKLQVEVIQRHKAALAEQISTHAGIIVDHVDAELVDRFVPDLQDLRFPRSAESQGHPVGGVVSALKALAKVPAGGFILAERLVVSVAKIIPTILQRLL